jgi:hypothetical protein
MSCLRQGNNLSTGSIIFLKLCCLCHVGHVDCLKFTIENGPPDANAALAEAIHGGHVDCVALLVAMVPPSEPYLHTSDAQVGAMQLRCFEYLLCHGWPIDHENMIYAAQHGNLDFARLLHQHRIPLWSGAREQKTREAGATHALYRYLPAQPYFDGKNIMVIPRSEQTNSLMYNVLRWGHACDAPVPPSVEDAIKAKRSSTRAVLLSFHAARRLSRGEDAGDNRAVWAGMHAVPPELTEKFLLQADLEIPESIGKALFARRLVETPCRLLQHTFWVHDSYEEC